MSKNYSVKETRSKIAAMFVCKCITYQKR